MDQRCIYLKSSYKAIKFLKISADIFFSLTNYLTYMASIRNRGLALESKT